jgi:hypothetical protein
MIHRGRPFNFFKDFGSAQTLQDRKASTILKTIIRTIVNSFWSIRVGVTVVILNKTDLVTQKGGNPSFDPETESCGNNNPLRFWEKYHSAILNTGLFNYEEAESSAGWMQELDSYA